MLGRTYQFRGRAQGFRFAAEACDPVHIRLAPEPRQLPLGVVAMALLGGCNCRLFAQKPRLHGPCLTIAKRVQRLDGAESIEKPARLVDESSGEHASAALVQVRIQSLARRVEADAQKPESGKRVARQHL